MEQKKRNSILRIPSKEDTQSTTGNDVRLPRRISFRTKKTVRVFCKDEDAQNWDNYDYEESERADSSSNSKTVVNSSTDLQATASTSALCTTSEFINKSNQGELIVEGSLAITLTEYEKNCMNKIKTDCTSSNQSDVIRKQQNNSTVKALPPPPTSEPIPSLACFDDNSNKENIPSECYGIGTKTGKKSSKDDDELSSSANMDIDSSANNFYSNTKSPKVIVRHEASYQQRIVTPAEEEESLEITHTEGGGLENNFSGIYPIEQSPLTSSFVMNNTDEFVQLNNDIGNGRMTPFRNYNNKKSSISVPNKKSFLSLEQRKPNHHHHISELSNRQNMDVGTLSLRTNNNNNNNTMYNTLEIAAETAKKQGAIPKRKSTYGGQMSLETICFDEEEDNIRKQKDMTRSKMAIDKENISQETQPPPHIACSSSTNKIFGRRTIYFSDEIIAEPQPMEETQMKIWNEIQKFNSERITFDNEKCIEKANRKASLYLNESLNISSKSSSNEKIEESQKQIMETQVFGSTIRKEKSHLGESKQKPYIEDGDYDQRRRHINKKDNKILIEDIHNSKQNDVISSTSTFRQNYSEATVTNKNLESYRPGHTFIGQNRLMSEMCHKRLFSTFETLDSPAFVQHPKSTDIEEFQIAATSETIRDTNNIEEIVVAIPQQQKQQSTSCRRTQVFENSAALMELNDDEPLPDENVVAKDLREKQKASRKTLHFGNDDDDDDGRIDFTINERKEEEQVCKKKLEFLHRSSTDAAIDTATNDDLVKKVPKSANRRTVTFSSSVVVDTNSIESTPLYHRKTNFSIQFNAYSPATPHRSVLEFEQLERETLQDGGGGDDPNSFIKDRSCQKRSPSIFTPNIPQSKKRHYKTQFFDNFNNVMDIDGDDRREELVMHHGLQADVVDNTMETSRGAINQEDNLCVDGDEVANRNDLARSSFVVNDTKWQSHIFNYYPNTFIEEEEKRREISNNEKEIHHIQVNETITTNAENPIDPKKLIATLSSSIKERTPSRIPIYFNGSERKKEMKQLSIKSPNDASLQTSIPTMRTDQMINETAHLTIENRSVQKKIIFECDDKPITVSDVSQHYLSSHRQQQSIEDGGRKEEEDEEEDGSGKPIIESPINASDDIDKTKLDLVETFLGESESSSSCIDLDDDIDDIDIFRCQSFQCENMAVVEEEETNNKKPSPSSSVFLCRKCRNCLQNETATASPSETFVMPSALPTLEEIAEEIEKKMIKYRKGPTLEKALELYKQWNLDDMFSESSSSEDEEITEESIIENNAFLKEAVERSKRITREYEERWAQIEENAKKKVIKCFVSRLKDLLDNNKNAHLWIMNAEMMHRQVLQFRYKEISTFCIILQYEKADIFGDNVVITHISLESSSVAERTLTPFDHMIRIQLQLELPFNLKSYCNGNTEFDVYEMLMKVDNICKNVLKMAKELWINVNEEDASLTIVNGHGHIKKIVRKKIYDENGYYQSTKLTNFCIEVIDIKNLCFKDIVMPPTYMFREDIENLPAGLEFLKIFLKNPKSFLQDPDN